jgi:hypothetical protein
MNDSTSALDSKTEFLAQFIAELHGTDDPQAAVRKFRELRPDVADEIDALAAMNQMLDVTSPREQEPPMPARLGEFRIVRRIGRGGMGEIYEGEQDSLNGRRVAIKVIRHARVTPDARARFLREQAVLARLHQTHIIPVHTAGEDGNVQYFAMPYVAGATLHQVIQAAYQETLKTGSKTPPMRTIASRLVEDERKQIAINEQPCLNQDPQPRQNTEPKDASKTSQPGLDEKVLLSKDYFRSVAELMADAAVAIQHARRRSAGDGIRRYATGSARKAMNIRFDPR